MSSVRPSTQALITDLVPPSSTRSRSTLDYQGSTQLLDLKLSTEEKGCTKDGKRISRIRLIANFTHNQYDIEGYLSSRVILTINKDEIFYIFPGKDITLMNSFLDLYENLIKNGATVELAFSNPLMPLATREYWMKGISQSYSKIETDFYDFARSYTVKKLSQHLKLTQSDLKDASKENLRVVIIGCGDGAESEVVSKELSQHVNLVEIVGFDISQKNIEAARKKHSSRGNFIVANANQLLEIIETKTNGKKAKNVALAIGCLTRQVNPGTLETLPVFQQALRCCDFFAVTGIASPLITIDMANSIGWIAVLENYLLPNVKSNAHIKCLYFLSKPNSEQLSKMLLARYDEKNGLLDFSMSGDPISHLSIFLEKHADKVENIQKINLTFCYLLPHEIELLLEVLKKFKNLQVVYHNQLHDIKCDSFRVIKTEPKHLPHEVPFYSGELERLLKQHECKKIKTESLITYSIHRDKLEIAKANGAIELKETTDLKSSKFVRVQLQSSQLKSIKNGGVREVLAIDRCACDKSRLRKEAFEYLSKHPLITTEKMDAESKKDSVMFTFPEEIKPLITQVCNDYDGFLKKQVNAAKKIQSFFRRQVSSHIKNKLPEAHQNRNSKM